MKVTVFRTAMIGGGLSYDVYVATADLPDYRRYRTEFISTIHRDSGVYVDFPDATIPRSHFAMPLGLARYSDRLAHNRAARARMLAIATRAFPELARLPEVWKHEPDQLPELWITGLLPVETSAAVTLDVEP